MSVPTEYDLTQDALIGPMRDILLTAAEPPSGPEFSYPVVDQAMSSSMWQWVTKGVGSGVLDLGDASYWLRDLNNSNQTAYITAGRTGTANAIVAGFYHQLSDDKQITLPMPSSGSTTYYVCLTFDPREESSTNGPVSLQVYSGTPPTSFARVHVVLWTVRRSANQLLTDATIRRVRQRVAPTIYVHGEDEIPDHHSVLWGTICFVGQTGSVYRARPRDEDDEGAQDEGGWASLTDPGWETFGDTPTYQYPGHGYRAAIQRVGKKRFLRGRIERTNGAALSPNSGGYRVVVPLAEGDRPSREVRFVTAGSNLASPNLAVVNISTSGEVRVHPASTMAWVSLDGVEWYTE